jgi:hypothetical protein
LQASGLFRIRNGDGPREELPQRHAHALGDLENAHLLTSHVVCHVSIFENTVINAIDR